MKTKEIIDPKIPILKMLPSSTYSDKVTLVLGEEV